MRWGLRISGHLQPWVTHYKCNLCDNTYCLVITRAQERAADILVKDKRKFGQGGEEVWKCGRSVRVPRVTGWLTATDALSSSRPHNAMWSAGPHMGKVEKLNNAHTQVLWKLISSKRRIWGYNCLLTNPTTKSTSLMFWPCIKYGCKSVIGFW